MNCIRNVFLLFFFSLSVAWANSSYETLREVKFVSEYIEYNPDSYSWGREVPAYVCKCGTQVVPPLEEHGSFFRRRSAGR